MPQERYFVTGASGCLGAWIVARLVREGASVASFDIQSDQRRLGLLLDKDQMASARQYVGDIASADDLHRAVADFGATHVIHCAALQVPFVRSNPRLGAQVNVVGMVQVFETALSLRDQVQSVTFASAAGVFGPADKYPDGILRDDSPHYPETTLYGVTKEANENTARFYAKEFGLYSTAIRPWVIYGVGRDQGMTSGPSVAMLAAAAGRSYHVTYGGTTIFHHADDAAATFIAVARHPAACAQAYNLPGITASVAEFVAAITAECPNSADGISYVSDDLPYPTALDTSRIEAIPGVPEPRSLGSGIRESIAQFRDLLADGRVTPAE
jgi:UDP-glucuronate 4-epimerase